ILVRLQAKYTHAAMQAQTEDNPLTDRNKVELLGQIARPVEIVRDWFYETQNYIDRVDRAAEAVAEEMALRRTEPHLALTERLADHGIRIRILPAPVMGGSLRRFDLHRRELLLSELLGQSSRRFQIGVLLARLEQQELIDAVIRSAGFGDGFGAGDACRLARVSLANYFAAALMMPYGRFLAACESERYDVELLSHRFGTSYEQTAHRMSTLQRPEARGIPFFFVRVDRAGNVSKRFSAGRFPFSRFGGTCPLWNIHGAFEAPGRVHTQVIR
ncbi:short-chain fatty acyl-CoA regulator family protein, partial [Rhodovulum sulfidophilum]|nr:short-chain fatty acyl-CoA regulator family protein [Rhodovulum sulfidophilum]